MLVICRDQDPQCNAGAAAGSPVRASRVMQEGRDYVEVAMYDVEDTMDKVRFLNEQGGRCFRCGEYLDARDAMLVRSVH